MKLEFIDNNHFIIYLMKQVIKDINFNDKKEIELYFKSLFKRLRDMYSIDINGYYNITLYKDIYYGIVLNVQKEDLDYYNYYDHMVDMRITNVDISFYYKVDELDIILLLKPYIKLYSNSSSFYIKIIKELSFKDMVLLLEHSQLIFDIDNYKLEEINLDKKN